MTLFRDLTTRQQRLGMPLEGQNLAFKASLGEITMITLSLLFLLAVIGFIMQII